MWSKHFGLGPGERIQDQTQIFFFPQHWGIKRNYLTGFFVPTCPGWPRRISQSLRSKNKMLTSPPEILCLFTIFTSFLLCFDVQMQIWTSLSPATSKNVIWSCSCLLCWLAEENSPGSEGWQVSQASSTGSGKSSSKPANSCSQSARERLGKDQSAHRTSITCSAADCDQVLTAQCKRRLQFLPAGLALPVSCSGWTVWL